MISPFYHNRKKLVRIHILKTNIETKQAVNTLKLLFNTHPGIIKWSLDLEDIDTVLRVESSKNISKEKLIESIQRVARGEKLYNNKILNSSNLLTPRETEIARSLMRGLTTKEIAREQALSPGTVRNYLSNLFGKLEARNRSEALVKLNERGLL